MWDHIQTLAMTQRRKWTAIPGLLALATAAVVLSAYSGASSSQNNSPVQPIAFPHPLHAAGNLNMNCLYCHNTANKSPDPGMPAVSTCMGCHLIARADRAERCGRGGEEHADDPKSTPRRRARHRVDGVRGAGARHDAIARYLECTHC